MTMTTSGELVSNPDEFSRQGLLDNSTASMPTKTDYASRTHNWERARWAHYDYVFYTNRTRADRKACLRKIISYGLSARDAIQEMREYEREK